MKEEKQVAKVDQLLPRYERMQLHLDEDLNENLDNDLEEVNIYAVNNEINEKNNNIDFLRDI